MAKRKTVIREDSDEVQGEGSYVVVTGVKVKEIRKLRKSRRDTEDFDAFDSGMEVLKAHVLEWNWVDDEGEPLPQPKEDPDVFDELTDAEATFLTQLLTGGAEAKN